MLAPAHRFQRLLAREKHYFKLCFRFVARAVQPFLVFITGRIYRAVSGIGNLVFELPVKQPITKGGSRIHLCLKEMMSIV